MNAVNTKMAKILRQARVAAGLTQYEVAEILGVARWTYRRAETGHRDFSSDWVYRLPREMQQPIARYLETVGSEFVAEMGKIARRRVKRPSGAISMSIGAQPIEQRRAA